MLSDHAVNLQQITDRDHLHKVEINRNFRKKCVSFKEAACFCTAQQFIFPLYKYPILGCSLLPSQRYYITLMAGNDHSITRTVIIYCKPSKMQRCISNQVYREQNLKVDRTSGLICCPHFNSYMSFSSKCQQQRDNGPCKTISFS